jgi:hypothetical protein
MEQVQAFFDAALEYARTGFYAINGPQGLLIALAATIFIGSWKQWLPVSLLAAVIHIAVDTLAPVLAGKGALKLPPLVEPSFWQSFLVLFAGYVVVIGIFFFVKRLVIRPAAAPAPAGKKSAKAHSVRLARVAS